jgi:hypothetical protein
MTRVGKIVSLSLLVLGAAAVAYTVPRLPKLLSPEAAAETPWTTVRKGDVTVAVNAEGSLQGGNSKMVVAPMIGSQTMTITEMSTSGAEVKEGDVVVAFDTTDETYKLREAQADLQEAEQQVVQAQNEEAAKIEELNYGLIQARAALRDAELEARRNPLLATITARQNDLAVEGARDTLAKLEHDYPSRKASATASVAIQAAARDKAKMQADTAQRNIDMMSVKAPASGYINVERNTNTNFFMTGMTLPLYQIGDQARPGIAVAQIPDMAHWEVSANIAEADRGHLAIGQPATIRVVALPGRSFKGHVKDLGGTTGSPWERKFECKMTLDDPIPELRPGMSAHILVTMETLHNVLWLPAQALFETEGKQFVYVRGHGGFAAKDVQLVRRSESQAVIAGLKEGDQVALASPEEQHDSKKGAESATKAVAK